MRLPAGLLLAGLLTAGPQFLVPPPAHGAPAPAPRGCPLAGVMPDFVIAGIPDRRDYAHAEFSVTHDGETGPVDVAGRLCHAAYSLADGKDTPSDLEIQENYRSQLAAAGATILFAEGRATTARKGSGEAETWVTVASSETSIDIVVVEKAARRQTLTKPSGNDYRLLGHMPFYVAEPPEKRGYDAFTFSVTDGDETREVPVRGAKYIVNYQLRDGANPNSDLEIQENYREALRGLGAQILSVGGRETTARLDQAGVATWVNIASAENSITISTIEEKALQLTIQPPSEGALKTALDRDGHVALYLPFDFDRATLRPEAAATIAEVLRLLKDSPSLALSVEGHTDAIGAHDYNVALSQARAKTVMDSLVAGGVAPGRLTAAGFGPDKPVADNGAPEGRARNRRVELVKS